MTADPLPTQENHKQVVASLEASLAAAKAEYDRSLLDNMTHSGRIVERLEAERDRLIAERWVKSLLDRRKSFD